MSVGRGLSTARPLLQVIDKGKIQGRLWITQNFMKNQYVTHVFFCLPESRYHFSESQYHG
jgi:hypothetical protein